MSQHPIPEPSGMVTEDRSPFAGARSFQVVAGARCVAVLQIDADLVDESVHTFLAALLARYAPPRLTIVRGGVP